jgi:hypothetical protein
VKTCRQVRHRQRTSVTAITRTVPSTITRSCRRRRSCTQNPWDSKQRRHAPRYGSLFATARLCRAIRSRTSDGSVPVPMRESFLWEERVHVEKNGGPFLFLCALSVQSRCRPARRSGAGFEKVCTTAGNGAGYGAGNSPTPKVGLLLTLRVS